MYRCKYCGKEYENKYQLGGHVTHCIKNPNRIQYNKLVYDYTITCKNCGKSFILKLSEKQFINGSYSNFCSRSCANTRIHSVESKLKISESLRKNNSNSIHSKKRICKVCGKVYTHIKNTGTTKVVCSKKCSKYLREHRKDFLTDATLQKLSLAGLKSVEKQSLNRRSKNEIYFYELCKEHFKDVLHNASIFNGWDADIIINDIKFAILWNGKWHYEKIKQKHSVEQVQNRDKIKIDNIIKCNYIPYIIKDMGKYNKKFVHKQFDIFIDFLKNKNYMAG